MRTKIDLLKLVLAGTLVQAAALAAHAAPEPAVCKSASAALRKLEDDERGPKAIGKVKPTHQAKILNGWAHYGEAGLVFDKRSEAERAQGPAEPIITPWGQSDVQVTKFPETDEQKAKGERNPMKIFVQKWTGTYPGADKQDEGTNGGIYKLEKDEYDALNGVTCPKEAVAYAHHYFPKPEEGAAKDTTAPQPGDVYCVRTRDGKRYALMQVETVCGNGVVFTYKYNGASREFAADLAPGDGQTSVRQAIR